MGYSPCWTPSWAWILVNELDVAPASTSAAAFTGEGGASGAVVEYFIDPGAPAPRVTVDIVSSGTSPTRTAPPATTGFPAHHFGPLPSGTKLMLQATDAMARLRWCEPV